jgi:hypothetical protein
MQKSTETVELLLKQSPAKFKLGPQWFRVIFVALVLIIGTAAVTPFYYSQQATRSDGISRLGLIATHDMGTHFAFMEQFDKVLKSGVYYPRWLPDINRGYGIATMNFYPPGFYYLTSFVHLAVDDWGVTLFVISVFSLAGSGFAFYFLSRQFYGRLASAVGAIFYMLLPYHTLDLYWRGAMPEFLGFVLLPVITYFAFKLGAEGRLRDYAGLGFFYGLHLITHFPVSYLFTYALALYALVWATRNRDWRVLLRIACGMALGLLLSAIYWLPAALESKHTQEAVSEIFPYHKSLITLTPGQNTFDALINHTFTWQTIAIILAFLVLRATVLNPLSRQNAVECSDSESQTRLSLVMAFTTTFMCTMFAISITKLIPKIQATVPAWRWLAISSVFTSLLVSASIHYLGNGFELGRLRLWLYRFAVGIVIALNIWISVQYAIIGALSNGAYAHPANFIEGGFTPKGATLPDRLPNSELVELRPEGGEIQISRWEPQSREVIVKVAQPTVVRLKTYNFPGWTARLNGQAAPLSSDRDGVQLLEVLPGTHKVEIYFTNTTPRTLGALLTGFSFFIIVGLTLFTTLQTTKRKAAVRSKNNVYENQSRSEASRREETEEQGSGEWSWQNRSARRIIIGSLLSLVLLFAFILIRKPFKTEDKSTLRDAPSTQSGGVTSPDTRLRVPGLHLILVATDENALNELMDVLPKGDPNQIENLVQSGKVVQVPGGTKVRILESRMAKTKVKILEGDHVMMEGWVPERWVQ